MSTLAFTVCFAVWTIFSIIGVQIKKDLGLSDTQFGLLVGTPILTGSLIRLLLGVWTDQYGGRVMFAIVMLAAAVATWLLTFAYDYPTFLLAALGVGIAGGIARRPHRRDGAQGLDRLRRGQVAAMDDRIHRAHRGLDLLDVGAGAEELLGERLEVVGGLVEVVVRDDDVRVSAPGEERPEDVGAVAHLDVDELRPEVDRLGEDGQLLLRRAAEAPTFLLAAVGDDHLRPGPGEELHEVEVMDPVDADLDEVRRMRSLLGSLTASR